MTHRGNESWGWISQMVNGPGLPNVPLVLSTAPWPTFVLMAFGCKLTWFWNSQKPDMSEARQSHDHVFVKVACFFLDFLSVCWRSTLIYILLQHNFKKFNRDTTVTMISPLSQKAHTQGQGSVDTKLHFCSNCILGCRSKHHGMKC